MEVRPKSRFRRLSDVKPKIIQCPRFGSMMLVSRVCPMCPWNWYGRGEQRLYSKQTSTQPLIIFHKCQLANQKGFSERPCQPPCSFGFHIQSTHNPWEWSSETLEGSPGLQGRGLDRTVESHHRRFEGTFEPGRPRDFLGPLCPRTRS